MSMTQSFIRPGIRPGLVPALAALLSLAGCGGGSGGGSSFAIGSISVPDGGTWQINRTMQFTFTLPVDFGSVNLNTIQISQAGGAPAAGEFFLLSPTTVTFQPRCPTLDNFSDAGLLPGGIAYTINLPGTTAGGPTVKSTSGGSLTQGQTVNFNTPNSLLPTVVFLDTALGPPTAVIQTSPSQLDASYVELGDDPSSRVYFVPVASPDPELGADTPGYTARLNLYSDVSSHVVVVVAVNQAVNPSSSNVNPDNVRLEYRDEAGVWQRLAHTVALSLNCAGTGAVLRLTPTGILPEGRRVRVVLTQDFKDLVGDGNLVPLTVGSFDVEIPSFPVAVNPGLAVDEVKEEFTVGGNATSSLEDAATVLADPRAVWGQNGTLEAAFAFDGVGGPGGNFDWQIGNTLTGVQPAVILNTSFSTITNASQSAQQTVINGRVDLRNFTVKANGTLVIEGPNPCKILCSGVVLIEGKIKVVGSNNKGVSTLNTTNQPEPGAIGQAGGGRGGAGSYLTAASTPAGENGFGAFNTAAGGGGGGESGYNPNLFNDELRRPAGGGGGSLGRDALIPNGITPHTPGVYTNTNLCPDQSVIGLDVEKGFPGAPGASGAFHPGTQPAGGAKGPRPFFDSNPDNDFWGTMKTQAGLLRLGELTQPWAGAGGGGGGDAIGSTSFPLNPWSPAGDEKGSGGGGAGGSLTILALGDITFKDGGRIDASGGVGGAGENSGGGGFTHIGGGSGGGSGGHVILQTASRIDFTLSKSTTNPPGGIYSQGGQGGAGRNDLGGAHNGGYPTSPQLDALPQNSYPSSSAPCKVVNGQAGYTSTTNTVGDLDPLNVVICAGGDGGPGIIQLHTPTLGDILKPTGAGVTLFTILKPPPIGSGPAVGAPTLSTINNPVAGVGGSLGWDQMLPIFGRRSQAISKWIPLGAASIEPPGSAALGAVDFSFGGTNASGFVATTGTGPGAKVAELASILMGSPVISGSATTPPYVTADERTLVLAQADFIDDIYVRNPNLLRRFALKMTHGTTTSTFDVLSASYVAGTLSLTVGTSGMPLAPYVTGDAVDVRPRFFRVITEAVPDSLPDSSTIRFEFQATTETLQGNPDTSNVSAWVGDITTLSPNVGANPNYQFFRFRVSFDISAAGAPLTFDTPIPSLDFLRALFKF